MHKDEDVGGWDTILKREEHEKLFFNQQATMEVADFSAVAKAAGEVAVTESDFNFLT